MCQSIDPGFDPDDSHNHLQVGQTAEELRNNCLEAAAIDPNIAFEKCETFKWQYKDTGPECEAQGFDFTPIIIEAHSGACSPTARKFFNRVSMAQAALTNISVESISLAIAQRISIALRRENESAIVKRTMAPTSEAEHSQSGWAMYEDNLDE